MFGFNSGKDVVDTQTIDPSVKWVNSSPSAVTNKTTVLYVTRDGKIRGRFDIPGTTKGSHAILMCLDGSIFRQMMIDHAPVGTMIEIIRPDNSSHSYRYLG
jgi:hypothetical protein